MKSVVSVRNCQEYQPDRLRSSVERVISDCSSEAPIVKSGEKVLLKPNLLRAASPERAIVTHPEVVGAVAEILRDCGAHLYLGDSPPLGNIHKVLVKSGYESILKKYGIQTVPFLEKRLVEFSDQRIYRRLELAAEVFDFDRVINIAKLKTHCQMTLTLGVKNLFGLVIGSDKASWHLRAGRVTDNFAHVLLQIYETVRPDISIIDGILGMQGNGPNSGEPRHVGILCASRDAIAMDAVVARLLGFPIESVRTCALGHALGLGKILSEEIEVVGDAMSGFPLTDFKAPKSMSMAWNLSYWNPIRRFMENHIITKPEIDWSNCKNCGICMNHCPPQAISENNGRMIIDRKKCISCFCCHELCGSEAISIKQPFAGRMLSRLSR